MIRPAQIILHSFPYPTLNHPSPSPLDAVTAQQDHKEKIKLKQANYWAIYRE